MDMGQRAYLARANHINGCRACVYGGCMGKRRLATAGDMTRRIWSRGMRRG